MTDTDTTDPTPVNPYDAARAVLNWLEAADLPCPTIGLRYHSAPDDLVERVVRTLPQYPWNVTETWITGRLPQHPEIAVFIPVQSRPYTDPTAVHARELLAKARS